ncbi:MAG: phosphoribosylglycinamide formyltransferase [Phycisphaerales bacterium JB059]
MSAPARFTPDRPAKLAAFASGSGRTIENLLERIEADAIPARIVLVLTSRACRAADIARDAGIPTLVRPERIPEGELLDLVAHHRLDLILLCGYLHLLPVPAPQRGRVLNIHPALLPDFGGPGMHGLNVHRAVLEAGRTESGCTVHFCDDRYDTGPVILQERCPVRPDDTPEALAARVFEVERNAYPRALVQLLSGQASPHPAG